MLSLFIKVTLKSVYGFKMKTIKYTNKPNYTSGFRYMNSLFFEVTRKFIFSDGSLIFDGNLWQIPITYRKILKYVN